MSFRCRRLSLTPLCYLWQRDQGELLSEMVEAGLVAILIKVAGVGLATKHLGKTLGEMQPTLQKLVPYAHVFPLLTLTAVSVEYSLWLSHMW